MKSAAALILFFAASLHAAPKPKLLWFDATANFARLSSIDSIRFYLDKAAEVGFTDVVVDVKPITGEVLYPSKVAPQMREWNGFVRPDSLDFLNTFIQESRKRNLRVRASLNVFVAGHNYFDRGVVYTSHPEWQTILYTDSGMVPITRMKQKYSAMTNPANPEIQQYEISVLEELVSNYNVDGIVFDRVRYDGIEADFSPLSRVLFENYVNRKLGSFPEDILEWTKSPDGTISRKEGKYFKRWLLWRATVIKDFLVRARAAVKSIRPDISLGDYTGSWYPIYYEVGANWASAKYDPSKQYAWAAPAYKNTGYAELLDLYISGNYYFEVTKGEVLANAKAGKKKEYWYSVEGSCEITKEVLQNVVPVFGGLYVEQYRGHPEQFGRAIAMCLKKSDGLMVFDLVHIVNYNWWDVLKNALGK